MGEIENKIKRKIRISFLQKAVLSSVAVSGLLLVGAIAPGILKFFKYTSFSGKTKLNHSTTNRSIRRLVDNGYIVFEDTNGKKFLRITETGKQFLEKETLAFPKKKRKWDKKWRIVIFDIKEKKRELREKLRNTLISIGFLKLQNSVWVYPYDCEDFIKLLKADFEIGKEILYIVADEIENSKWISRCFGISTDN